MSLLLGGLGLTGCQDAEQAFINGRVSQTCNQSWPVCDLVAGCILGDESYISGLFPNSTRVIARLQEPSQVTANFFLKDVTAAGTSTVVTFYETGCSDRTRIEIAGDAIVQENEQVGFVSRTVNLTGLGDHRIEFSSDLQAHYDFRVDVNPLRLSGTSSP